MSHIEKKKYKIIPISIKYWTAWKGADFFLCPFPALYKAEYLKTELLGCL